MEHAYLNYSYAILSVLACRLASTALERPRHARESRTQSDSTPSLTKTDLSHRCQAYDITEFLAAHPGGAQMLELSAGRDSTIMYESGASKTPLAIVGALRSTELLMGRVWWPFVN